MGDALDRLTNGLSVPVEDSLVRLARLVHVKGYRRQGDGGDTENVHAYVRKDLGSFGGLNAKTKRGIFAPTGITYLPAMAPPERDPAAVLADYRRRMAAKEAAKTSQKRITLYRGEGSHDRPSFYGKHSSEAGGWWTTDLKSARQYAAQQKGHVFAVDVAESEVEQRGGANNYFITDPAVRARRVPLDDAPTTHILPAMAAPTGPPQGWRPTRGEPFNPYMSQEQVDAYRQGVKQAYRTKGATVEFRKDVTPEQRDRLLNAVKDVSTRLPLGYPLYVVVDSPKQTGHIGHMLTSPESKRITVLPENLTEAVPESANKWHMAAFARDPLLFDLAHEVGHVVDANQEDTTSNARAAGKFWRDQSKTGGLSSYGKHRPDYAPGSQGDRAEGYGEAFAQYLLGEPGDDPAQQATAQAYAAQYGWDRLTKRSSQKPISWSPKPATNLPLLADPKTGFRRKSSSGAKVATYSVPETQAWLAAHPVDPKNIVTMYDSATPDERRKGRLWYPQAHAIATELSKEYGVSEREAAGMIAAYSPQTPWGANIVRASEVLRTGQAVGGPKAHLNYVKTPNDLQETRVGIMASGSNKKRAQALLDGQDFEDVFAGKRNKDGSLKPNALKIRAFGELVARGEQDPSKEIPDVVVDRHAAGVARGVRFTEDDYGIDGPSSSRKKYEVYATAYRDAAKALSAREGRDVTPEEVQSTTWLARQRLNMDAIKARKKLGEHDIEDSLNYFASYDPDIAEIIDDPMVGYAQLHPDRDVRVLGQDLQQAADPLSGLKDIAQAGRPSPPATGTASDPISVGSDLDLAVRLLAEGKHVRLDQPDEVAVLMDKVSAWAKDVKAKTGKNPVLNLCSVTVRGTNLFCVDNEGVPRVQMPQLSGVPLPGSPAASLANAKGRADLGGDFRDALASLGIKVEDTTVPASHLRATQDELDGVMVAGISNAMRAGTMPEARLFVSRDNYIIDGHHRWAAKIVLDSEDNVIGDTDMPVSKVDLDIGAVLDFANEFAARMGMPRRGLGVRDKASVSGVDTGSVAPTTAQTEMERLADQTADQAILKIAFDRGAEGPLPPGTVRVWQGVTYEKKQNGDWVRVKGVDTVSASNAMVPACCGADDVDLSVEQVLELAAALRDTSKIT